LGQHGADASTSATAADGFPSLAMQMADSSSHRRGENEIFRNPTMRDNHIQAPMRQGMLRASSPKVAVDPSTKRPGLHAYRRAARTGNHATAPGMDSEEDAIVVSGEDEADRRHTGAPAPLGDGREREMGGAWTSSAESDANAIVVEND